MLAAVFVPVSFMGRFYRKTVNKQVLYCYFCIYGPVGYLRLNFDAGSVRLVLKNREITWSSEDASKFKNPIDKFIYKFNVWYANSTGKYTSLVEVNSLSTLSWYFWVW